MKFSYDTAKNSIQIALYLRPDEVRFYVTNSADPATVTHFECFVQKLLTEDPYELYINQLECNAEKDEEGHSGLGLLTMMNDYQADIAWKLTSSGSRAEKLMVTTMVRLSI